MFLSYDGTKLRDFYRGKSYVSQYVAIYATVMTCGYLIEVIFITIILPDCIFLVPLNYNDTVAVSKKLHHSNTSKKTVFFYLKT